MPTPPKNGAIRKKQGVSQIHYDGYWVRYYTPPPETLAAKKRLIDALTRRTFHHTESGINTPGEKLEEARRAWQTETDPKRKRVNGAMLAGALFNRATDIFTTIVELEERGIDITPDNALMQQCAACFTEALELSPQVKHHSGEEGVDEIWGEPVKVFTMPIKEYYFSRYRKVAHAMREMEHIGEILHQTFCCLPYFAPAAPLVQAFIKIAKQECEIFRSDPDYYRIWPKFVATGEDLLEFQATVPPNTPRELERHIANGARLLRHGKNLITWVANVRVPMPRTTKAYLAKCEKYRTASKALNL